MQPQQPPPIHETHQNLTALLSNNAPSKEVSHPTSMNSTMGNYTGPGPGHPGIPGGPGPGHSGGPGHPGAPGGANQYHSNMMTNGGPGAGYAPSSYNNTGVPYSGSPSLMYSSSVPSSNTHSVTNSMPMSAMPNQQPIQQQPSHPGSIVQSQQAPMQSQPGMPLGAMMNGPSSVMNNMTNRPISNNIHPRLPNPQVG